MKYIISEDNKKFAERLKNAIHKIEPKQRSDTY